MPKKNSKSLYLAALVLFLGGIVYLVVAGASSDATSYWIGVAEVKTMPTDKPQSARVFGTVKTGELVMLEEGAGVRFQLEDKDDTLSNLWVSYKGTVPDGFESGAEVIVDGVYIGAAHDFNAHTLITTCPSKYEKKNRES